MMKSSNQIEGKRYYFGDGEVTVQEDHGDNVLLSSGELLEKEIFLDIAAPADNMMNTHGSPQQSQPKKDPNFGKTNHRSTGGRGHNPPAGEKLDMPKEVASMIKGLEYMEDGTPILPTENSSQAKINRSKPFHPSGAAASKPHQYQPVIDLVEKSTKKELKAKVDISIKVIDQALLKAIHEAYGEEALEVVIEHLYLASAEDLKQSVVDTIKKKCKIDTDKPDDKTKN